VRTVVAREGFADAHLGIRGVRARYWLLAALLPLTWNTAGALLDVLNGSCVLHADVIVSKLPKVPVALAGAAVFLVGEELGWRSYLVEKLRPAGPVTAFFICGLVWFAWHPQIWLGPTASWRHGVDFFVSVMCLSFIFGWLYYASGSVWPGLVMHVLNNLAAPGSFKGGLTCVPDKPLLSDVVLPLLLAVIVLRRTGAFDRDRWTPRAGAIR
jgi:membrane protease YdiL (CAAX protease family)